ncbi:MAG: type II toxin-antitoxin system VapC family toxin [bacterium]|nr:type II toxin-antitoxin system VapC family toxin [bacterium]
MGYSLDTNIIIDLLDGNKEVSEKIEKLENENKGFSITPIVLSELYKGAFLGNKKEETLLLIENFLKSVTLLRFEKEACKIFGEKYAELKKIGRITEESDLIIASICMTENEILVTRNYKHFKNIKGLKVLAV